jgi:carboxyl-terminal processing protease
VIFFLAISGILIGRLSIDNVSAEGEDYGEVKIFAEILSLVKKNYVDEVDDKDLVRGAIKGMLNTLDPHSSFMAPDIYKEMQINTRGEFGGLGIQISIKDKFLTIIAPIEDTPAYRAGLESGDKIVKIDGETTKDMDLHDAVTLLRRPKGTSVTITIFREGLDEPKDYTIIRDIIKIKSVKSKIIDEDIGYVKITQFQEKTGSELRKSMKELDKKEIKSLILDLRNNPGGLLNASIDVAGYFMPSEKLVVYIKDRAGERIEYVTSNGNTVYDYPMIVLVNQGSASASEIVAGALQDWDKAVILGTSTFGKGSVQTVIPLSDGSGLRLTTARYYTPKDRSIQAKGIEPDIIVELNAKSKSKGHIAIREKDLEGHLENDKAKDADKKSEDEKDSEMVPGEVSEKDDIQLQRAIDLLKTWRVFKKMPEAA